MDNHDAGLAGQHAQERRTAKMVWAATRSLHENDGLARFVKYLRRGKPIGPKFLDALLCEVCRLGHVQAAKMLLRAGANPNANPNGTLGCVGEAITNGPAALVRLLYKQGATLDRAPAVFSPLGLAAKRGEPEILRVVLDQGANVNQPFLDCAGAEWDVTPLIIALAETHTACVEVLLRHGADPNSICYDLGPAMYSSCATDPHGWEGKPNPCSAFELAVATCNTKAAQMLQRYGSSMVPAPKPLTGRSANQIPQKLRARALNMSPQVLRALKAKASFQKIRSLLVRVPDLNEGGGEILAAACKLRRLDVMHHLLECGADPNGIWYQELPEICGGSAQVARLLIQYGFNVKRQEWYAPLNAAIVRGEYWLVRLLLSYGADGNRTPKLRIWQDEPSVTHPTPLSLAIHYNELKIAKLLINFGADPNMGCGCFPQPENALLIRKYDARSSFIPDKLAAHWLNPEERDRFESIGVPLHLAILNENPKAVSLLLKHGALPRLAHGLGEYLKLVRSTEIRLGIDRMLCEISTESPGRC